MIIGHSLKESHMRGKCTRKTESKRTTEQDTEPSESPLVEESEAQPAFGSWRMLPVNNDMRSTMSRAGTGPETKTTKEDA